MLKLTLQSPLHCSCVRVSLFQECTGSWSHDNSQDPDIDPRVYAKLYHTETVALVNIWNPSESDDILQKGSYEYRFNITVPETCSSSLNYWDLCESAVLKESTSQDDYCSAVQCTLIGEVYSSCHGVYRAMAPVNIKGHLRISDPILRQPKQTRGSKRITFWCFDSGLVEFTADVPRVGYNIDDDLIPITVEVDNKSSRLVFIKAAIFQRREYRARYCEEAPVSIPRLRDGQLLLKEFRKLVASSRLYHVRSLRATTVDISLRVKLANYLPTTISECFALSYVLQVSVYAPLSNGDPSPAELEITLGR